MNARLLLLALCPICFLAARSVRAQSGASGVGSGFNLDAAGQPSPNRFGLSYRMGFNAKLNFNNVGGYAPISSRTTPSGDPYNYDNGYVYNDTRGPAFGQTWYWGYDAAPGQYTLGSATLNMQRSSSPANLSSKDQADDPQPGFDVTYNRELHHGEHVNWGLESAFGYTDLSVRDSHLVQGDVMVARDAYAVPIDPGTGYGVSYFPNHGGNGAPYQHGVDFSQDGNNPAIGNMPTALPGQIISGGAVVTGSREFEANLYGFRLGPYVELPLGKRVALNFSGGLALAYVESDFSFNETVSIAGVGSQTRSGSGSHSGWMAGGYGAVNCSITFAESWAAFAGAQFMDVGQYRHSVSGKEAVLDLRQTIFATFGISHSF